MRLLVRKLRKHTFIWVIQTRCRSDQTNRRYKQKTNTRASNKYWFLSNRSATRVILSANCSDRISLMLKTNSEPVFNFVVFRPEFFGIIGTYSTMTRLPVACNSLEIGSFQLDWLLLLGWRVSIQMIELNHSIKTQNKVTRCCGGEFTLFNFF